MKRFIAIVLILTMLTGMASVFSGCGAKQGETLKLSDWIVMVNDKFGMAEYQSENPLISSVRRADSCFAAVQIAAEWDVIRESDGFNPENALNAEYAAATLARVADLTGGDTLEISNEKKLTYPAEVKAAVNAGVFKLSGKKFKGSEKLTVKEAQAALDAAHSKWATQTFEPKCEYSFSKTVTDLSATGANIGQYSYDKNDNTVFIPREYESAVSSLASGETYILPPSEDLPATQAFRAEKITYTDDYIIITNSEETVDMEQTLENLDLQYTETPDLLSAGYVVDGNGNTIYSSDRVTDGVSAMQAPTVGSLMLGGNAPKASCTAMKSMNISTQIGGLNVSASIGSDNMSVSLDGSIGKGVDVSYSQEFKNFDLSVDFDIGLFKLKKAYARLDYTTVETRNIKFDGNAIASEMLQNAEGSGANGVLASVIGAAQKAAESGSKSITLFTIPMVSMYGASINLVVKFSVSVTGELKMTITTDHSEGVELKGGSVRIIKNTSAQTDFFAQGKITANITFGLVLTFVGVRLVDVNVKFGIGCIVTAEVFVTSNNHLEAKAENLNLSANALTSFSKVSKYDITSCFDIYSYLTLTVSAGDDSLLGKVKKVKMDIWTKDNKPIEAFCCHFEDGHKVDACTRNFENAQEETTQAVDSETSAYYLSQFIELDTFFISLAVGTTDSVSAVSLPDGYSQSDITWKSDNNSVAAVNGSGSVTGVKAGSTTITVSTKDGKYSASCAVTVTEGAQQTYAVMT